VNSISSTISHKLYWYKPTRKRDLSAIPYPQINVGRAIARFVSSCTIDKHIGLEVEEYFKKLIGKSAEEHWGAKGLALINIGILMEPDFSLNIEKILMDLSREYVVIIIGPFIVENSRRLAWDDTSSFSLNFPEQTIQHLEI
jgi:hypothetical protein